MYKVLRDESLAKHTHTEPPESWVWWHLAILALQGLRLEDYKHYGQPELKKKKKKKKLL